MENTSVDCGVCGAEPGVRCAIDCTERQNSTDVDISADDLAALRRDSETLGKWREVLGPLVAKFRSADDDEHQGRAIAAVGEIADAAINLIEGAE